MMEHAKSMYDILEIARSSQFDLSYMLLII